MPTGLDLFRSSAFLRRSDAQPEEKFVHRPVPCFQRATNAGELTAAKVCPAMSLIASGVRYPPFLKGHKNDYRDAEAIAEAVQRPTMHFGAIKTPEQMDLLALHRVRSRLVSQRTGVTNQIRGFLMERGIIVRQGVVPLRRALPDILSSNTGALSPRIV